MRRREFITGTAVSVATWPPAARAQQPPIPAIGVVRISARGDHFEDAFRQGLAQAGYAENRNVAIEWRWAEGHYERLPDILNELIARRVAVIAVPGATAAALAAKAATKTIPIVFMLGIDPVEFGLVASLAHPGGNITGVAQLMTPAMAKRLDLLRQLVPTSVTFGLLTNPANP
jgi:putative ABC transport system substrate-binding protein